MQPTKEMLEKYFWKHVLKKESCWIWVGFRTDNGYGQLKYYIPDSGDKRRVFSAHRASWIIHNGPIPEGKIILHKCDVRYCVNPEHLRLGTHAENSKEMVERNPKYKRR